MQGREYGIMKSMRRLQELVRTTRVNIYGITADKADICFRELYFAVGTLFLACAFRRKKNDEL